MVGPIEVELAVRSVRSNSCSSLSSASSSALNSNRSWSCEDSQDIRSEDDDGCGKGDDQSTFSLSLLQRHFGHRLLVILFVAQHLVKGFALSLAAPSTSFLYKAYRVPGPQAQIYRGVTMLPWSMKPIIGLLSDAVPIMGYHKAPYMLVASAVGVAASAIIGWVPQSHLGIKSLVACLFLVSMQVSVCDLLTEATYTKQIKCKPKHGPALMSYVWGGVTIGCLVGVACVGPMIERWGPKSPFLLAVLPLSCIVVPLMMNYLEEVPVSKEQKVLARKSLMEQKEACFLCLLMFVGTMVLTVLGIVYDSAAVNAVAALVVAVVMLVGFSVVLRPLIAKVNAFFLIQSSLGISISGASFYFYTDTPEQFPNGPHFGKEFFTSVLGVAAAVFSLLGVVTYQRFASEWTYHKLILTTNIVLSILSLSDAVFFLHLNRSIYIPDHAFVLGSSVMVDLIAMWMWMPGVVITSQLCPAGMEATMFALLAGCHNLGGTIASNMGALVLEWLGCQPNGAEDETEQFKYLWVGSLLSTVLPAFTLILLPWMIPDAKQTDKLLDDDDCDALKGSLLRRWQGR